MELRILIRTLKGPSFCYSLRKYSLSYLVEVSKRVESKDLLINLLVYLNPYSRIFFLSFLNKIN